MIGHPAPLRRGVRSSNHDRAISLSLIGCAFQPRSPNKERGVTRPPRRTWTWFLPPDVRITLDRSEQQRSLFITANTFVLPRHCHSPTSGCVMREVITRRTVRLVAVALPLGVVRLLTDYLTVDCQGGFCGPARSRHGHRAPHSNRCSSSYGKRRAVYSSRQAEIYRDLGSKGNGFVVTKIGLYTAAV